MSSLVILALMIISGTRTSLSSKIRDIDSLASSASSPNDVDFRLDDLKKLRRNPNDDSTGENAETRERPSESADGVPNVSSSIDDLRTKLTSKKARKHKAFFLDYPFVPQIRRYQHQTVDNYDENLRNYELAELRKKLGHRKRYQQESQIYYIKLPPTPYMYVPGLGYISQPPTYSTSGLQKPAINHHQRPSRPQNNYHKPTIGDPFINLPVDFVSNGKPTGVYQWPGTNKKPESSLNSLSEGPYAFNGRPTSLYLLTADGRQTGHQPIRLADYSNDAYY